MSDPIAQRLRAPATPADKRDRKALLAVAATNGGGLPGWKVPDASFQRLADAGLIAMKPGGKGLVHTPAGLELARAINAGE